MHYIYLPKIESTEFSFE